MSRYTAMSDVDYFDEPWNKPEPCATKGCDGVCDSPSSCFCYDCRTEELIARANANARHQRELAETKGAA